MSADFNLTDEIIDGFHYSFFILCKKLVVSEFFICPIISVILRMLFKFRVGHGFTRTFIYFPGESAVAPVF